MPRFFICKPGDSNERKIKVRVNPSSLTANNATVEVIDLILSSLQSGNYFTEDVSLNVFMNHLIRMAVQS